MPFTQLRSGSVMVVVFTTLMRQPYRESGLVRSYKAVISHQMCLTTTASLKAAIPGCSAGSLLVILSGQVSYPL